MYDNLFEIVFDNPKITNPRMVNYMQHAISAMKADNAGGQWTTLIALMEAKVAALMKETGDVDTGKAIEKGTTKTANEVTEEFETAMSQRYEAIVVALGGKTKPAVLEFYPSGKSEYNKISRNEMPTLTDRINKAAVKYSTQLGADLSDELKGFKTLWTNTRGAQLDQEEQVDKDRTEVSTARSEANVASHNMVHQVATKYPGETERCESMCDFDLLFKSAPKGSKYKGTVAPGQTVVVFNEVFAAEKKYHIRNLSNNAMVESYFTTAPNGVKGENFVVNDPSQTHIVGRAALGWTGPEFAFFIMTNLSDVNEAQYEVVVK